MRKAELQITTRNIFDTYIGDEIKRNEELFAFLERVLTIEGSYSIALNGAWGSGKTFFVKQLEMVMLAKNSWMGEQYKEYQEQIISVMPSDLSDRMTDELLMPIYYDAWKNDNDEDPIISIIYCIAAELNKVDELEEKKVNIDNAIREITKGVLKVDVDEIIKKTDILEEISKRKEIESKINKFFSEIQVERGNKVVIFIDELDRCRPVYAIHLLERIKHYFENDNIIFIFSTNLGELQHTINNVYGKNFDSGRYLDRFFDWRITLPEVKQKNYFRETVEYEWLPIIAEEVSNYFGFQMREKCKYKVYMEQLCKNYKKSGYYRDGTISLIECFLIPVAYALQQIDLNKRADFIAGDSEVLLVEIIESSFELQNFCSSFFSTKSNSQTQEEREEEQEKGNIYVKEFYKGVCRKARGIQDIKVGNLTVNSYHRELFHKLL